MNEVDCEIHGRQDEAFVCQHLANNLSDRPRPIGFHHADNPSNPHPDAWCSECNARFVAEGSEWRGEARQNLEATLLCAGCYDVAKHLAQSSRP